MKQKYHKYGVCKTWHGNQFWNITFTNESEVNVKKVRDFIDEENKEEEQTC